MAVLFLTWKQGIGDKIGKKIDEFIKTGKLEKLEKVLKSKHFFLGLIHYIYILFIKKIYKIKDTRSNNTKLNIHSKLGLRTK